MDSDETIPPDCGRGLRGLVEREIPSHVLGFIMLVHCPGYGEDGEPDFDVTMVDHVKLFRSRPELRFDHRIHEQILPAIRSACGEVAWTDLYVVHSGSDQSRPAQEKKRRRDLHILELELAERPEHPFTLFYLGMTHVHRSRFVEAVDYLRRGIARSGAGESHLDHCPDDASAHHDLGTLMMRAGRHDEAVQEYHQPLRYRPNYAATYLNLGYALKDSGRIDEAARAWDRAARLSPSDPTARQELARLGQEPALVGR